MQALQDGKKVRCTSWANKKLYIKKRNNIATYTEIDREGDVTNDNCKDSFFNMQEEWELVEEPPKTKPINFYECITYKCIFDSTYKTGGHCKRWVPIED